MVQPEKKKKGVREKKRKKEMYTHRFKQKFIIGKNLIIDGSGKE